MRDMRYRGFAEPRGGSSAAFTLVELIVVLAIIALMAAVAIPSFSRMGLFSHNRLDSSTRSLYSMLSAARVYAITYRVCTAVAYDYDNTTDEATAMTMLYKPQQSTRYVPWGGAEGEFQVFDGDTCVFLHNPAAPLVPFTAQENGMKLISMTLKNGDVLSNIPATEFEPSGRLAVEDPKELYRLHVGYTEEADSAERYDQNNNERYMTIELHRSTGRAKIASD